MIQNVKELENYFLEQIQGFPGKAAYLFTDMEKAECSFERDSKIPVVSASMIKVPIMLCLFDLIEQGEFSLSSKIMVEDSRILEDSHVFEYGPRKASLYELTVWMIVNSDNTATNVLISLLGMDRLNVWFQEMGFHHTKVERLMLDYEAIAAGKNNWISPQDFYLCMKWMKEKEAVHKYAALALHILKRNRDHDCLLRYLYEDSAVAHKTGGLDGIVHDAGIFYTTSGAYFLGVFLSEFEHSQAMEKEAQKLIGRLSRKTYELKEREAGAWKLA